MGCSYTHITIEKRCEMARLYAEGHSLRQIAATLDRAPSSIARELKRNAARTQGYQPRYADQQARARRWQGSKLDRDPTLRATVLERLRQGWSSQQVAGRRCYKNRSPASFIALRRPLAERPPGKAAAPIAQAMTFLLAPLPPT